MKFKKTYGLITFIILAPLLLGGYIQSFDMPWGPHLPSQDHSYNTWLVTEILNVFSKVLSGELVQKLVLISIIILSATGSYKLLQGTVVSHAANSTILIAGILYIFNSFFYTRLMAGQWLVLIGYALLPWAILVIYRFLQKPNWSTTYPVILTSAAIGLTSLHTIGIVLLATAGLVATYGKGDVKQKLKWGSAIISAWIVINSFWLVPFIAGNSRLAQSVSGFDSAQSQAFATQGTVLDNVPVSAALLTGFWADDQNRYILPSALPIWWIGIFIIAGLVITGLTLTIKRRERFGIMFIVLGLIAWLLGMGTASLISRPLTELLTNIIPFYAGYREPQKWLMLLALAYSYFAAIGGVAVMRKVEISQFKRYSYGFMAVIFIAPFLYAPTLAFGATGQLRSAPYPAEWAQAKQYLNIHDKDATVLVLPWHVYLPVSFTGRVVANPTPYYFNQKMIISDDLELKGVKPQYKSDTVRYIDKDFLPLTVNRQQAAIHMHEYRIQYVMLLKEADWQRYNWLHDQQDLPIVLDNDKIQIYKVDIQ